MAPGPGRESRLPAALAKSQCCLHPPPATLGTPRPGGRAGEGHLALCPTVALRNTYCSARPPLGPGSGSCPDTPAWADPHPVRPQHQDPAWPMWAHGVLDPGEAEETEREEEEGIQPALRPQWVLAGGCRLKTPGEHITHPGPQAGGEGGLASQWGRWAHRYLEMAGCGWGGLGGGEGRGRFRGGDHRKPKLSHRRVLGTCGGQCSRSRRTGRGWEGPGHRGARLACCGEKAGWGPSTSTEEPPNAGQRRGPGRRAAPQVSLGPPQFPWRGPPSLPQHLPFSASSGSSSPPQVELLKGRGVGQEDPPQDSRRSRLEQATPHSPPPEKVPSGGVPGR